MRLIYALRFMTILPIPYKQDEDMTQIARSSIWFPLVGLIIGSALYGCGILLTSLGLELLIPTLITILWILFTGGLHLDGLADTADGLGGKDRKRSLEIMKDSRVGSFGALALICHILLKIACINILVEFDLLAALCIAPMFGRLIILFHFRLFSSARPGGMGEFFKSNGTWIEPIIGTFYALVIAYYLIGLNGLLTAGTVWVATFLIGVALSKRLGGLTGDCYGATIELGETLSLLSIIIIGVLL
mgnify:CR=1 FL=1